MKYWLLVILLSLSLRSYAEGQVVEVGDVEQSENSDFFESKAFDMLKVGTPLVMLGFVVMPAREEFQNVRNHYCGDVRFFADDYLQYSPAALMVGLKVAGVKSRSSWGRMIISDALSVGMVSIMVNSVKRTIVVNRPYSHSETSLPSGHTATAFMSASLLHKEYGAVSPWFSIAGYSIAATTGAMRVVNNQHWVSDVLVGAGMGILSTEIGYLLADLIFKDKGINKELDYTFHPTWSTISSKTSLGLNLGFAIPANQFTSSTKINMGAKLGVEGFHLFDGRWGVGASAALTEFSIDLNDRLQEQTLDVISANVGAYYAQPITKCWRVGAKAFAGMDYYDKCEINGEFSISEGARAAFGAGATIEYITNKHWSIKAYCDYNAAYIKELPRSNLHRTATIGAQGNIIF